MSDPEDPPRRPRHGVATKAAKADRDARLAQAMRDNLRKRRRQQAERRGAEKARGVKPSSTS